MSNFKLVGATASATHRVKQDIDVDIVDLNNSVIANIASLDYNDKALQKAATLMDSITVGLNAAEHVKKVTGNEEAALVATVASTSISMSSIGISDNDIKHMINDTDYEAAVASATDVIKDAWETVKKYAAKVWEYIRNLVNSVMDYIAGIFGKGGESGKVLKDMLKDLKEKGKVRLNVDKFNEGVQERIAKSIPYIVGTAKSDLSVDDYKGFITAVKDIVKGDGIIVALKKFATDTGGEKSTLVKLYYNLLLFKVTKNVVKVTVTSNGERKLSINGTPINYDDLKDTEKEEVDKAFKELKEKSNVIKDIFDAFTKSFELEKPGTNASDFKDYVDDAKLEEELGDDVYNAKIELVGINGKKLLFCATVFTDKGREAYKNFKDNKYDDGSTIDDVDTDRYLNLLRTIINGVKVVEVTMDVTIDEALSNKEYIVPLGYSDAVSITETLKTDSKVIDKTLSDIKKNIKQAEKDEENIIKNVEKSTKDLEGTELRNTQKHLDVIKGINTINRDMHKILVKGYSLSASELASSSLSVLIKESARLYEK